MKLRMFEEIKEERYKKRDDEKDVNEDVRFKKGGHHIRGDTKSC